MLVADTHKVVADTYTVVADTKSATAGTQTVVVDAHTMVVDIRRSVLTGRKVNLVRITRYAQLDKGEKADVIHHFRTALSNTSPFNWHDVISAIDHDLAGLFLNEGEWSEAIAHIDQALPYAVDGPTG